MIGYESCRLMWPISVSPGAEDAKIEPFMAQHGADRGWPAGEVHGGGHRARGGGPATLLLRQGLRAEAQACGVVPGRQRLLLVVDQSEEFFRDPGRYEDRRHDDLSRVPDRLSAPERGPSPKVERLFWSASHSKLSRRTPWL
ncbi:hypothetical protein GCM10022221_22300 [Actinocorallia aurea]